MMADKTRLNLLIDREQAERLKELARRRDVSVSWLVRRAIDALLSEPPQPPPDDDPLLRVLGSFADEPLSSADIDDELYGRRTKPRRKRPYPER